jgi:hypothetical protein
MSQTFGSSALAQSSYPDLAGKVASTASCWITGVTLDIAGGKIMI